MALVVEDGTGKADAESYVSVAEVDTYLTTTETLDATRAALKATWDAGATTTANQEAACREATRYIEANYLDRFMGYKGTKAQALSWPRTGAADAYGWSVDADVIPQVLKDATAELALRALSSSAAPDIAAGGGALSAKVVQAGSVRLEQAWSSGGARERAAYDRVDDLLRPLLTGGGTGVIELKRA